MFLLGLDYLIVFRMPLLQVKHNVDNNTLNQNECEG